MADDDHGGPAHMALHDEPATARHRLLHFDGDGNSTPARSCPLCRDAERVARIEADVAAGKLVRG